MKSCNIHCLCLATFTQHSVLEICPWLLHRCVAPSLLLLSRVLVYEYATIVFNHLPVGLGHFQLEGITTKALMNIFVQGLFVDIWLHY